MQEAEIHPMDVAATEAVAQGWCEPETSGQEMDAVLATAIARPVSRVLRNWYDTAAQHCRNEDYYRGFIQEIGAMLGEEAFISDDGSVQQDVLCAKVPELVRALKASHAALVDALEEARGWLASEFEGSDSEVNLGMLARIEAALTAAKEA